MKPQALQDAIKAAAAKKRNKLDSVGWKEPVVKVHKMTADEFKQESKTRRPQAPLDVPAYSASNSYGSTGSVGVAGAEILQKIEKERQAVQKEKQEFLREKQEILNEMRAHRKEMSEVRSIAVSLQRDVDELKSAVERLEVEDNRLREKLRSGVGNTCSSKADDEGIERLEARVERLEDSNNRLKEKVLSGGGNELEKLRAKVERLQEETSTLREKLLSVTVASTSLPSVAPAPVAPTSPAKAPKSPAPPKSPAKAPKSPAPPKSPAKAPRSPAPPKSPVPSKPSHQAPKSPKSPSKPAFKPDPPLSPAPSSSGDWPYLRPHTAEKLSKYQARDEALKAYLSHPDAPIGMYPRKTMTIESVEGRSLVFFRNKVYIPDKLREKHMQWYLDHFKGEATEKIAEHCTWPHQDRDMLDFIRR